MTAATYFINPKVFEVHFDELQRQAADAQKKEPARGGPKENHDEQVQ